jgi:hypothetical protein
MIYPGLLLRYYISNMINQATMTRKTNSNFSESSISNLLAIRKIEILGVVSYPDLFSWDFNLNRHLIQVHQVFILDKKSELSESSIVGRELILIHKKSG